MSLKVQAHQPMPYAPAARRCPGSPYALDYCIINNQHFEVRTKETMSFTEGKAGYFKVFILGGWPRNLKATYYHRLTRAAQRSMPVGPAKTMRFMSVPIRRVL